MKYISLIIEQTSKLLDYLKTRENNPEHFLYRGESSQILFPLSYLYKNNLENNPYYHNEETLDLIKNILKLYQTGHGSVSGSRRHLHPLVNVYSLLENELCEQKHILLATLNNLTSQFIEQLNNRKHITKFSSANVGYGTNHLAIELAGVAKYFELIYSKKVIGSLDLKNEKDLIVDSLDRMMNYMHQDGYWPESNGPTIIYNSISANALLWAADSLSLVEKYRDKFRASARFHSLSLLPNNEINSIIDGRMIHGKFDSRVSVLGFHPQGKDLYDMIMKNNYETLVLNDHQGEVINNLLNDMLMEKYHVKEELPCLMMQEKAQERLSQNFGFVKNGPWLMTCSNLLFRPRPEGHWNLDYQNLFSLYHDGIGSIFNGGNSKNDPELASFSKGFTSFDGMPIDSPMWKYIPGDGEFTLKKDGFSLFREYRGFEGLIKTVINNSHSLSLYIKVNTRLNEFPINFNAILPLDFKDTMIIDGETKCLEEKPFDLKFQSIVFSSNKKNNYYKDVEQQKIMIELPLQSRFTWGFKRYDCYNLTSDRYEDIADGTAYLSMPVVEGEWEIKISTVKIDK